MTGWPGIRALFAGGKTARWLAPLTLVILLVVFFIAAVWNIGTTDFPDSNCTLQDKDIRLDLGTLKHVSSIYLLIQEDSPVEVDVYAGSPDGILPDMDLEQLTDIELIFSTTYASREPGEPEPSECTRIDW